MQSGDVDVGEISGDLGDLAFVVPPADTLDSSKTSRFLCTATLLTDVECNPVSLLFRGQQVDVVGD